jgi:RHS repeat-associated protein
LTVIHFSSCAYTRDVYGRIIGRTVDEGNNGSVDKLESYVYDGADRLMEFNAQGKMQRRYMNGPAVDMILAADNITWTGNTPNLIAYWLLSDPQNTVRDAVNAATHALAASFDYDDFGKITNLSICGSDLLKDLARHQGRPYDRDTKLYDNNARMYNPVAHTFTSEDPIALASGESNFYRSCKNSPQNYTDPSGCIVNVAIGAGVGGLLGAGTYLFQYATGSVKDFSWTDLGIYTGVGLVSGGLAGATFGASLLVTGTGFFGTVAAGTVSGAVGAATGSVLQQSGLSLAHSGTINVDMAQVRRDTAWGAAGGAAGAGAGWLLSKLGGAISNNAGRIADRINEAFGNYGFNLAGEQLAISSSRAVTSEAISAIGAFLQHGTPYLTIAGSNLAYSKSPNVNLQEHHFATNKNSKYTPKMEEIANKYGLGLDEPWNKEMLPQNGRHPEKYNKYVLENMKRAATKAGASVKKFLNYFEKYVKEPVRNNPDLLQSSGWEE